MESTQQEQNQFNFEKLNVYQNALALVSEIFSLTSKWPRDYAFSLTDQIRRAVLSILLNIAEGSSQSKAQFRRFLDISRGSCWECIALIEVAYREGLLTEEKYAKLRSELTSISKMLSRLKSSINPEL